MTETLHMIGNAHIDPVWLWQWPEGYQEVRATFQSAIDRMQEYPEFIFTCDSVCYLEWVEETDPDLLAEICKRVADGRWQLVGGWWIEPDCNVPGGESFVRQALYAQHYLASRFGLIATVGCNVDPFGHAASLPKLLRGSGIDSYMFLRPGPHELVLPGQFFWWEAADGSRVLTYRIPNEYCTPGADLGHHLDKAIAQLPADEPDLMVFYGVGNHGGGPTRANLDSIRKLDATGGLPHLQCSSPRAFFDRIVDRPNIPVHAGELQHHAVGCYSAHSGVKQWNRRAENLLLRAEKWATIGAIVADQAYPLGQLTEAWKLVLFSQFHDILAGTSIEPAYDDARDQYGHASSIAAFAFNRAIQSISRRIDIPVEEGATPLVVFNPHPWTVQTDVEFELGASTDVHLVDADGAVVPSQQTQSLATMQGGRQRVAALVELPPLGYATYRIRPGTASADPVAATDTTLDNGLLLVEVDPATGWLSHLIRDGVDYAGTGRHTEILDDTSDTWGHRVVKYDNGVGEFACRSVRVIERGPVRSVLRVRSTYGASTLIEDLILVRGMTELRVRATLEWHERLHALKIRVPTTVVTDEATFEVAYGDIVRPTNGCEESAQAWVDVSATDTGLAVLNDGKPAHDVKPGDIGMTVARSPVYAWHDPKTLADDAHYSYLDQGTQRFSYVVRPHAGDWRTADVGRQAALLNQQPFCLLETYHAGDLPQRSSYVDVATASVDVSVVKFAEDGSGDVVLRIREAAGRTTRAEVGIPLLGRTIEVDLGPAEVTTVRVPRDGGEPVRVNLLEWTSFDVPS